MEGEEDHETLEDRRNESECVKKKMKSENIEKEKNKEANCIIGKTLMVSLHRINRWKKGKL